MTPVMESTIPIPTTAALDKYTPLVGAAEIEELRALAAPLEGSTIQMVNSTAVGGGVAEILARLLPLMRELGLEYEPAPKPTRFLNDGEIYEVGSLRFLVRHVPGHTRGHIVLAEESEKAVFTGDCLFSGTIGRTDLPGGDYDQLIKSITERVLILGDDFTVYCGHGPETTIGRERISNPFLAEK